MNDDSLFHATVPVFRHYLDRIAHLLAGLPDERDAMLQARLVPQAFCAAEHFATAIGFARRTLYPLIGCEVPDDAPVAFTRDALLERVSDVEAQLAQLAPADFEGAAARTVTHIAGTATLEQDAITFATRFGLPNFFFHLTTAFAILRREGMDIGKADFDGQHVYPDGFRF